MALHLTERPEDCDERIISTTDNENESIFC